jgi:hypothetical protein
MVIPSAADEDRVNLQLLLDHRMVVAFSEHNEDAVYGTRIKIAGPTIPLTLQKACANSDPLRRTRAIVMITAMVSGSDQLDIDLVAGGRSNHLQLAINDPDASNYRQRGCRIGKSGFVRHRQRHGVDTAKFVNVLGGHETAPRLR